VSKHELWRNGAFTSMLQNHRRIGDWVTAIKRGAFAAVGI
jgi:hypothetical protein